MTKEKFEKATQLNMEILRLESAIAYLDLCKRVPDRYRLMIVVKDLHAAFSVDIEDASGLPKGVKQDLEDAIFSLMLKKSKQFDEL